MELSELLTAKRHAENELASAAGKIVQDFKTKTGLSICDISIPLVDVTTHGDAYPQFEVAQPSVGIAMDSSVRAQ